MQEPFQKVDLVLRINQFRKIKSEPDERMLFVQECLKECDSLQNRHLKHHVLQLLSDLILVEELTDRNSYKVAHTEYPILSKWQQEHRHRKEFSMKLAEEYAADGKWYRRSTKTIRN